jgi:molybdate transport system ATP-binding protein
VLVTHDRLEALALGDNLVVLDQGRIVQQGAVSDVFNRPVSLEAAGILAFETVQRGRVLRTVGGLVTVSVGERTLTAVESEPVPDSGEVYVCIRAEDVILVTGQGGASSARNHLQSTVKGLVPEGPLVRIELDCGFPLTALLTRQSCEELALAPGASVLALVKAPHIHLIARA